MRGHSLKFLILSLLSALAFGFFVYFVAPNTQFIPNTLLTMTPFANQNATATRALFFILLALFLFSSGTYVFKSKTHGILIASFAVIYLIFRLSNLTNPFFLILLAALFLTLELFVSYRK
jgi:hypothetical protein